jgi:hypothetical protein
MLLQAVIGACLETPKYFCNGPLDLSIALWMRNRCIADLDVEVFIVLLKTLLVNWDPLLVMILFGTPNLQTIDLINSTVDYLLILSTWVASDHFVNLSMATYKYRNPPTALGNRPKMSSPHTANGHEGGIIFSVCAVVWICLA